MNNEIKIKGIINKAEFEKLKPLKTKIIQEKGGFPCCGTLEKKYIDEFWQILWDDDSLRKEIAEKENWHGKIEWSCDVGQRVFYL